jgi:prepilin-type N-terminal cleavage/methylation domain-containing protein
MMNMMDNNNRSGSQRGFSLIEMLMVIAIIAIMCAVALPFFGGFIDNRNLKSAARGVAGDMFETRERAISEDRVYQITFDIPSSSYKIYQCTQINDQTCAAGFPNVAFASRSLSEFGSGLQLTSTTFAANTVQFQARGTINNGALGVITLINKRNSVATVKTTATGRTFADWALQ